MDNVIFDIPEISSGICLNKKIFSGDAVTVEYHSGLRKLRKTGIVEFCYDSSFLGQEYYLMLNNEKVYFHSIVLIQKKDKTGIYTLTKQQINIIPCYYAKEEQKVYYENDRYLEGIIHFETSNVGYTTYLLPVDKK